ncbi:MAG: transglycosylase SLT domain-containing protein [Nanoarchaeota archaeon]
MTLDELLTKMRRPVVALATVLTLGIAPGCEARGTHHSHRSRPVGSTWASIGPPHVGYEQVVLDHNFRGVELADRNSTIGRIQRTERWRNIIETAEDKYGIPRNTIYAVIMQESYGDPIQPNASGDGGLGLIHFQPGTARAYGLHIAGNSRTSGADHKHGRQLRELIRDCNYDVPCILQEDDRAHPVINIDAIARYLKDGFDRKHTWDGAIGTINPGQGSYASRIKRWRGLIKKQRPTAALDFGQRNRGKRDGSGHTMSFNHYIDTFLSANERNYGLAAYRGMKR